MVRPKKHLGQHFLKDENIAEKIVGLLPADAVNVVEIGAGTGALSKRLLDKETLDPLFFEIDAESVEFLKKKFPGITSRLIEADFLTYDVSLLPKTFILIGNFPYNISSQILFRVLENRDRIPIVIGMFQREVAERIASPPGTRKSGILSVFLKAFYDIEYMFTVNEDVFFPAPKVKSGVIRMIRNKVKKLGCEEDLFFRTVKTAFNQRRKTLRNALKGMNPETINVDPDLLGKRAEQLSVEDFIRLTNSLQR